MKEETQSIETIEDVVKDTRLVDRGIKTLKKLFGNAPSLSPERRRFMRYVAGLTVLIANEGFLTACTHTVQYAGKTYSGWEAYLLSQDLIRGPHLLIYPETGRPGDFKHHLEVPWSTGWGSVDYDAPSKTPIVPTADAYGKIELIGRDRNIGLKLFHMFGYRSVYSHLRDYTKIITTMPNFDQSNYNIFQKPPIFSKLTLVAFSGDTGEALVRTIHFPPHLDFNIKKIKMGKEEPPGLDAFKLGIDQKKPFGGFDKFKLAYGGRPVYWDGKTKINFGIDTTKLLEESLDTLAARLKESDLDKATIEELLKRQKNPIELRDYLGYRVLEKKPSPPDGKPRYEFMSGSLMYALMLEFFNRTEKHDFIAMLPFIFPPLKEIYQKANPGVKF